MKIKKILNCIIISTICVFITACSNLNAESRKNEMATKTPSELAPTTPPTNEDTPSSPAPGEITPTTPPTTVDIPKTTAPETAKAPNTIPNTTANGYAPATSNAVQHIPVKYAYSFLASVEDEVLSLCNAERGKVGAPALTMDSKLRDIARYKAMEMLQYNYFNHNSTVTGKTPYDLANSFGYSYKTFGENIQMSQGRSTSDLTASYLVTNWMNSPGHKANILNPAFKRMGIGVVFSSNTNASFESQMFSN